VKYLLLTAALSMPLSAMAGNLVTEYPAEAPVVIVNDQGSMGSSGAWLIPLLALGIIAIAVSSSQGDEPACTENCGGTDEPISKHDRLDELYGNHHWQSYDPVQRQCVVTYYQANGADGDWSSYQVCE
jgi:hypothetical protein